MVLHLMRLGRSSHHACNRRHRVDHRRVVPMTRLETTCPWFWGSHGCDREEGHEGNHECRDYGWEQDDENPEYIVSGRKDGVEFERGYRKTGNYVICCECEQGSEWLFL